ncbi:MULTISPECIES: LppW family protein [unclassified Blastococcus]
MRRPAAPPGRAPSSRVHPRAALCWLAVLVVAAGLTFVPVLPQDAGPLTSGGSVPAAGRAAGPDGGVAGVQAAPLPPARAVPPPPAVAQVAQAAGGAISFVVLRRDGALLTAADPDRRLPTASLVKLLVVEELLTRLFAGSAALTMTDLALMSAALTRSDDAAMSALWVRHDGPALVTAAAARHGLTGTAPPAVPGQWGLAPTTARDVAVVLSAVTRGSRPADATMRDALRGVTPVAADGFDQVYGVLGAGGAIGAKQGWMCCVDGRRHLHSAGVLPDGRVVVLLGEFPAAVPWATAVGALDTAAGALIAATAASDLPAR